MTTGILEGWDRPFLYGASLLADPICWAYGLLRYRTVGPLDPTKFNNCESKIAEVATRICIATAAVFATATLIIPVTFFALGIGHKVLRAIGFALQKEGYTHVRGQAEEKKLVDGQAKIMTWNVAGIAGGMHYDHAGVIDWPSRLDGIVAKIIAEDPDVLVLQEIYDTALAEALIEKLGSRYAHFFTHLGANVMGSVGGGMVLSKCAIHRFTNTPFENNHWTLTRTFTTLDIKANPDDALPCARIVGTHLIHDSNPKRMVQVAQIVDSIAKQVLPLPTVLMGDLNLEREKPEEGGVLNRHFKHAYQGAEPTATNRLVWQWNAQKKGTPGEWIDYISLFKNQFENQVEMVNTHLVKAHSEDYNTKTALSDHHGVVTTLRGLRAGG